jgi:hypothetical protein
MITCNWKQEFGVDCLTCGLQRSIELLLKGEFIESFYMFPATMPLLLTFVIVILHIWKRFNQGHKWIISMFSLSAVMILINFSIKMSNGTFLH